MIGALVGDIPGTICMRNSIARRTFRCRGAATDFPLQ